MKKIIRHIEYLLMTHECVIIPGLGAVLSHSSEAVYDSTSSLWTPPTRAFAFNPELNHNDGLLAASIARRDRVSLECGTAQVAEAVEVMRRTLESERTLQLGIVGTLTLLADGRLSFVPGSCATLSPALMWLPAVDAPAVARASQIETAGEALSRRLRLKHAMRQAGGWAACIAVICTLAWIAARNMGYEPQLQFASIFPFSVDTPAAPSPDDSKPMVLILASAPADEIIENVAPTENQLGGASDSQHPYCVIVGSFNTRAEAEKFIAAAGDSSLKLLDKDGRWRVYAATASTYEQAAATASSAPIASRYPSNWVCHR